LDNETLAAAEKARDALQDAMRRGDVESVAPKPARLRVPALAWFRADRQMQLALARGVALCVWVKSLAPEQDWRDVPVEILPREADRPTFEPARALAAFTDRGGLRILQAPDEVPPQAVAEERPRGRGGRAAEGEVEEKVAAQARAESVAREKTRRAKEAKEKAETAAAVKLELARQLLARATGKENLSAKARERLEEIIVSYPGTKAAKEAQAELDRLGP
jgi:hypothetical protein